VKLTIRLFTTISVVAALAATGLVVAADRILRREMEAGVSAGLAGEARLVARLVPADSNTWSDAARTIGRDIGHRITLIDSSGRVRGDTDFDRLALARLENHAARPEVRAALARGMGRDRRTSASTNEPQLYVAIRGGPPGIVAVRVSASLAAVDAQIAAVQRAIIGTGVVVVVGAAVLAWLVSQAFSRPLTELTAAAQAIAAGQPPTFPDSRVPEIAGHTLALRRMHDELAIRFEVLRREREETRTLIEAMSDGVIAANPRGEILACNASARRLLEYGADAPLPALDELFHDKPARDLLAAVHAGQDVEQREVELDGRTLLASGRRLPDGGTLLVLRDVTTLRRLETMRRDFVANVSHELKTPLTSIAGYAETLAGELTDAQTRRFAETILASAQRMQQLVDDLLDLSRIESGGWRPAREVVALDQAARDAWAPYAERATAGRVAFDVTVAAGAHAISADPGALRQVLANLYDNALRHTPAGGRIRVSATRDRDSVNIAVQDSGAGISSEHLPRVFERFYRVDAGRARDHGGTGLGLAIVKHLVEAHGGRVEAESRLGHGTTVVIRLPVTVP
jgi:two-component system, OmpR family, phosphate regulon sensor histidine kinase PhoR